MAGFFICRESLKAVAKAGSYLGYGDGQHDLTVRFPPFRYRGYAAELDPGEGLVQIAQKRPHTDTALPAALLTQKRFNIRLRPGYAHALPDDHGDGLQLLYIRGKLPTDVQKLQAIAVIVRQGMSVSRAEPYIETLLRQEGSGQSSVSVGAFLSYLNQSLARIQLSGISAVSERRETDSQIVLTITIPKI